VTPKFKSLYLRHILSELNILLAALIIIFPMKMLQISTKSTAQFPSNRCFKNGTQKQKFPIWKSRLSSPYTKTSVFTALHGMQTRSSDENSVCLSVCHTHELWQNGRKICPDFYTIRKNIYPSFLRRRMVGGGW